MQLIPEDFDLKLFLNNLPNLPGVYRMFDNKGQILYVGKAVSLRNRVRSYFNNKDQSPRISLMIMQIAWIEITVTRSESEALILENNFIKSLSPKYNILFRDDKTYPYLKFSAHPYPQMSYFRGNLDKKNLYFGPYPNSQSVRESIQTLQKLFQLRTCENSVFSNRKRPCLLHQIKRCSAPCTDLITEDKYQHDLNQAIDFIEGKTTVITEELQKEMFTASDNLEFEEAARIRDQLLHLNQLQSQQFIDSQKHPVNIDVIATKKQHNTLCLHWTSIRAGRYIGDKNFFTDFQTEEDEQEYTEAFISQHYLGKEKPEQIISNFEISALLQQTLRQESLNKISFIRNPQGERKVWLKMAIKNAEIAIGQKLLQSNNQQIRQQALAELANLSEIKRLECFDISHTFGEATVASCVVYDDNAMQPAQYRYFNIKTAKASDDYAAMQEVLTRRYTKLAQGQADAAPRPDIVIVDGGKGQISVALKVWAELGLDIPLIGVAKGPERKAGMEELIFPQLNKIIQLPANNPALHLLQTIRDEAHRFAITGHRKKREKNRLHSSLDDISGIGPKRKKELLLHFGSLRKIQAAAVEDIANLKGISLELAEKIYRHLHK